ncbi:conserved repeat domain-containing protein [Pustulibacterium marinum]|uniref:Conserved repeat domain-containing protein n=1 Tax=Pustulibacterium marinum TaxID=1224947 RepID=A0A1I7HI56_9FLAO|nr:hypothetical protein [Pustulibacterium marinum]SFU60282.1 conserved repeat domain-containing protein [Pustulibacterium marinum]
MNHLKITSKYISKARVTSQTYKNIAIALVAFLVNVTSLWSQEQPQVSQKVDTTAIKIGDQINYTVTVKADSTATVLFPEKATFMPLELVEASKIDTTKEAYKFIWKREYALTQFDSGAYYIPRQKILVNEKQYLLDSIRVQVGGVVVDTTKQKMYDIKPLVEVEKSNIDWLAYWWILIPLAIIGFLIYWFVIRKKPLTEEEKIALLPPFDRAMEELKRLENSKYIIESKHKEYYSELTIIVKRYLEEETHISALESTTDELFLKLEMLQDSGNIELESETIANFKKVLQKADLVKFARVKPDDSQVNTDTKVIEEVVVKTKESLPPPTEQQLEETEAYREMLLKRRRKERVLVGVIASVLILIISSGVAIGYLGFTNVKDTLLGHPTRELKQGEWVTSQYGFPPIKLTTPKVLRRVETAIPEGQDSIIKSIKTFQYGSVTDNFFVTVGTIQYQQGAKANAEASLQNKLNFLQANGVTNMVTKQEEFSSQDGGTGTKVYGTADFPVGADGATMVSGNYEIIQFTTNNYEQAVIILSRQDDDYAQDIIDRIESSIEVNSMNKQKENKPQQ